MMHNAAMQTHKSLIMGGVLVLLYAALHAWWVADYPPMRNDDHFNVLGMVLTLFEDSTLYPNDLTWHGAELANTHGFLFLWSTYAAQIAFGSIEESWWFFSFILLLVYLPGFYLFLRVFTPHAPIAWWVSVASTVPIYLHVTFAKWGFASFYAHAFITALSGWAFWGFFVLLQKGYTWRIWGLFGLVLSLTMYINPVNGGALLGILSFLMIDQARAQPHYWRHWLGFLGGVLLGMIPYIRYYLSLLPESSPVLNIAAEEEARQYMAAFHAGRLYPWSFTHTEMNLLLLGVVLSAAVLWVYSARLGSRLRWVLVGVQLLPGFLFTGHLLYVLVAVYRWLRPPQSDTFDRWLVLFLTGMNLLSLVAAILTQYLWLSAKLDFFYAITYEPIRLLSWTLVPLYVWIARWMGDLMEEKNKIQIGALLIGVILSFFGTSNPIQDESVLMKTLLPIRWGLVFFVLLGVAYAVPKRWLHLGMFFLLVGFLGGMQAWDSISLQGVLIGAVLLGGVWVSLRHAPFVAHRNSLLAILAVVYVLPIAGYHKHKPDLNWCDVPYLNHCVDEKDVLAAAGWLQQHTPKEARIFVAGIQPERFQPLAQRSTLHVNIPYAYWFRGASGLYESLEIEKTLVNTNPLRPDYGGDAALFAALTQLDAPYIAMIGGGYTFDLPIAYENESVIIYEYTRNPNR